jgi:sigma-B regulation protein RsbU (phosphoserine phosphatase)
MSTAISPRIVIGADQSPAPEELRLVLERASYAVSWQPLSTAPDGVTGDLWIIESQDSELAARQLCRSLRSHLAESFVPILFITPDADSTGRVRALEAGADLCLSRPFVTAELLAQVQALVRLKRLHDRAAEKSADLYRANKQLAQTYGLIDQELELARRVQQSMLPRSLPEMPPARFAVRYHPSSQVGGDFYDVIRLDENHVGFYVGDVMGHGVPAGLLAMFLQRAVRAKEIVGRQYRLLAPDEVLRGLNHDLIYQALADQPFVTMIYALFDRRDGTIAFSRAGHPHPLYLPRSRRPELWPADGTLLGVFDTQFTVQTRRLRAGDKLLLYTDGVVTACDEQNPSGAERLLAEVELFRDAPIDQLVAQVGQNLLRRTERQDDFTLLGLEVGSPSLD